MPKEKESEGTFEEQEDEETRNESELEKEIEEDELEEISEKVFSEDSTEKTIDDDEFKEFIQSPTESTAPVLEKIAGEQELGAQLFFTPGMDRGVRENDNPLYGEGAGNSDEPKYENNNTEPAHLSRVDTTKIGRDAANPVIQESRLMSPSMESESQMQEKRYETKRIDMQEVGRQNPSEQKTEREVKREKSDYVVK